MLISVDGLIIARGQGRLNAFGFPNFRKRYKARFENNGSGIDG